MCGRYYTNEGIWDSVKESFPELRNKDISMPAGDVTPGMTPHALVAKGGTMDAKPLFWGIPGFDRGTLLINARAESVREKPTFADSYRERRCLLPASGFYEWNRKKEKVTFKVESEPALYLAGIFKVYGTEARFVILTREANASMQPYHDRMPLIFTADETRGWLFNREDADSLIMKELPMLSHEQEMEQLSLF